MTAMTKKFASQADLADKKISFVKLADNAYAYTAEGDPNSGIVIGEDAVMVIDTQATPIMARDVIARIRQVTDKPIKYVVLSHYHAVRVMGASAYGAPYVISSEATRELIVERGQQDFESEVQRFPRLFRSVESVPGLTWPNVTFDKRMTIWMGKTEVQLIQIGAGHTKGDTIVWLPKERVLFSGDLVEYGAAPYAGDAHFTEWPQTLARLRAFKPAALVPGRGDALTTPEKVEEGIAGTQSFIAELYAEVHKRAAAGQSLKQVYDAAMAALRPKYGHWVIFDHCMPFDVSRAYDEARGIGHPRIWTAERDVEMWRALEQAP